MHNLVLIVEGHGDVQAYPHVVGKVAAHLGLPVYAARPIRAGGWGALKKAGGLEKFVEMAVSRPECDGIVVVVDLDDGCPVAEREDIEMRRSALSERHSIRINIVFCIREFETWILHGLDQGKIANTDIKMVSNIEDDIDFSEVRGAKERLRRYFFEGYSESSDQEILAKALDVPKLFERDRSFRRFVKVISGKDYPELSF